MVWVLVTIGLYMLALKFHNRFPTPFALPILTVTLLLALLLTVFGYTAGYYNEHGGHWLAKLLSPAIVALALPLYKQRVILRKNLLPILLGVISGIVALLVVNLSFGKLLHFEERYIFSTIPQSTTMPIALGISEQIGGIPSLTAVFVVIAGISGAIFGPVLMNWLGITSMTGKGVGMGCASHIIGVSQMQKEKGNEATIASVTMIVTGLLTSIIVTYVLVIFL